MTEKSVHLTITKEQIGQLPIERYDGEVVIVDTPEKIEAALTQLNNEHSVGFDTETRPSFKKGVSHSVALVQIATHTRCYLFRICKTGLTKELIEFFENDRITKVGLSLKDDFNQLHKVSEFEPREFVELQTMVHDYGIDDASLQKIYAIVFGKRISKTQRLTNWSAAELTQAQQDYASLDARACLRLYDYLCSGKFSPAESPYQYQPEASENLAAEPENGI